MKLREPMIRWTQRFAQMCGVICPAVSIPTVRCPLAAALTSLSLLFNSVPAAEVATKVVDGLGGPVPNAVVDIHWLKSVSANDVRKVTLVKLVTDREGIAKGRYDEAAVPKGEDIWVEISRDGFSSYSTTGLEPQFILKRQFDAADVKRIAALEEVAQREELRQMLAGEFDDSDEERPTELLFTQERKFRHALRALVPDPRIGTAAADVLALIGVPDDLRLVVDHAPAPKGELFDNRWAYSVACALLSPTTDKEWAFLRDCAVNRFDDSWVDAGAIQTLRLIASARSKQILKEAGQGNKDRAQEVEKAIQYIESPPPSLSHEDLAEAGKRVANAIRIGQWKGNKTPRFNEDRDKALVDIEFVAGRDRLIYTATFHKLEGKWQLRGVRETMQALMAKEVE